MEEQEHIMNVIAKADYLDQVEQERIGWLSPLIKSIRFKHKDEKYCIHEINAFSFKFVFLKSIFEVDPCPFKGFLKHFAIVRE